MGAPNQYTSPDKIVLILLSIADWHIKHRELLQFVLGNEYNGDTKAQTQAENLRKAEQDYQSNRRDEVRVTEEKHLLISKVQRYISSLQATVYVVFSKRKNAEKMVGDFVQTQPSRIRSENTASKSMQYARTAIIKSRESFDETFSRTELLIEQANSLIEGLDQIRQLETVESQETRTAKRERSDLIEKALDFIRETKMVALSVEYTSIEALRDLRIIFETHNPKRFKTAEKIMDQLPGGTG